MKKTALLLAVFLLATCETPHSDVPNQVYLAPGVIEETPEIVEEGSQYYSALLEDVTNGDARGAASASFGTETKYLLEASVMSLPELEEGFFYEGWLVRTERGLNVLSTGALMEMSNGDFLNLYESETDLSDHTLYIVTLEPDDGDPAPAEHVLEGELEPVE